MAPAVAHAAHSFGLTNAEPVATEEKHIAVAAGE
jgi:hypothetical protein